MLSVKRGTYPIKIGYVPPVVSMVFRTLTTPLEVQQKESVLLDFPSR